MKLNTTLEKIGTVGMFVAAFTKPCCFPLFGFVLAGFGISSVHFFQNDAFFLFQILVGVSLFGTYLSFRGHKNVYALALGVASALLIVYAYNVEFDTRIVYAGMFSMLASTGLSYYATRKAKATCPNCIPAEIKKASKSTITCPACGHRKTETMPIDACQFFYKCQGCKTMLKPKSGDCCVYCSYGDHKCPSVAERNMLVPMPTIKRSV